MIEDLISNRTKLITALDISSEEIREYTWDSSALKIEDIIVEPIKTNSKEDYLIADSDPDKVSYSTNKDPFSKRTITSLARYIRRKLNINQDLLSDNILDLFCRTVKSNLLSKEDIEKNIKILSGKEVEDFYKNIPASNALKSCMTGDNAYKTRLYADNPDKVSLVVYNNKARALLWTTNNKIKILDRVYPTDGSVDSQILIKWCKYNNYLQKKDLINQDKNYFISLKRTKEYPYIDTFYYGSIGRKVVKLSNRTFLKANCVFQSQHGDYDLLPKCMFCKKPDINSNFIYYGEHKRFYYKHLCQDCVKQFTQHCSICKRIELKEELKQIEYWGKKTKCCSYCAKQYSPRCNMCSNTLGNIHYEIFLNGFIKNICEKCAEPYYTCYSCKGLFSENKEPKHIKRNNFYCNYCSRF